jgi:hypothetical protein
MMPPTCRIINGIVLTDSQSNPIKLTSLLQLTLGVMESKDISIAPNTNFLTIPFPQGITTAAFAWVFATEISDLAAATAFNQGDAMQIPQGAAMVFYNLNALWLSSVAGGLVHIAVGA